MNVQREFIHCSLTHTFLRFCSANINHYFCRWISQITSRLIFLRLEVFTKKRSDHFLVKVHKHLYGNAGQKSLSAWISHFSQFDLKSHLISSLPRFVQSKVQIPTSNDLGTEVKRQRRTFISVRIFLFSHQKQRLKKMKEQSCSRLVHC